MNDKIEYGSEEEFEEDQEMLEYDEQKDAEKIIEQNAAELQKAVELAKILQAERWRWTRVMYHQPTHAHSNKSRGVGVTRKSHSKSAKNLKIEKKSRKINRGKS